MVRVACSLHAEQRAKAYCLDCDSQQNACLLCMLTGGRHAGHLFGKLEEGLQRQVTAARSLLDATERKTLAAMSNYKKQVDFKKKVKRELLQPLEQFSMTVDKLIGDLQKVKVDVYTAVLRAAQTAQAESKRGTDFAKFVLAVHRAAKWVGQVRYSLKGAALSNLSDLVHQASALRDKATELQGAMQVPDVDLHSIRVHTSVDSRVNNELDMLSDRVGSLLQLANDLVGQKPANHSAQPGDTATDSDAQFTTAAVETPIQTAPASPAGQSALSNASSPLRTASQSQTTRQKHYLLILAGGWNNTSSMAYDTRLDTWREVAPLSCARYGTAAALWQGKMVVAGGFNYSTYQYLNLVEQYTVETNSWTALANMQQSRRFLALACFEQALFAIGGRDGTKRLNSVERYTSNRQQWQRVASLNTARAGLCCAVLQGAILAAGGRDRSKYLKSCELFNGVSQKWQFAGSMVTARCAASAATLHNKVYVFGGHDGEIYSHSVEEYDQGADKWTLLPVRLSVPRDGLAAATVNSCIYVCGGEPNGDLTERFDASEMRISHVAALPKAFWGAAAVSVPVTDDLYKQLTK